MKRLAPVIGGLLGALIVHVSAADSKGADWEQADPKSSEATRVHLGGPLLVTQLPVGKEAENEASAQEGMLRSFGTDRARLLVVYPDASTRVLCGGFYGVCDAAISFDATRILFAGKPAASDDWNIYETTLDGSNVRQITRGLGDCRSPAYHSILYTLVSSEPQYRIVFVSNGARSTNEYGFAPATHLYSCNLDGSAVCRLTYNLSSDVDPLVMSDGRVLFASWQRRTLDRGILGRVNLFGVNVDGTDCALFATDEGRRIKRMPCATTGGLLVFVESDRARWDGAGYLSCVRIRRPLHSYRRITREADGLFHSPSPLPDGRILVSRRPRNGSGTHAVTRFDPRSGKSELVFDDPRYHDVMARLIGRHREPDGRSSVVLEKDPHGKLYCLNVYTSDLKRPEWMPPGTVKGVRVLEGLPLRNAAGVPLSGLPPLATRRILGEIDIEADGSFNIEIPANTPIELQILDASGMALRSCGWIWAKNRESRGCIGCHEDQELTPENSFKDAFTRPSTPLCPPPLERRIVDFRRDVMPIIDRKCVSCHGQNGESPRLDGGLQPVARSGEKARFNRAYVSLLTRDRSGGRKSDGGKYVQPGRARTSPLIWHVFGRNTSRPWDGKALDGPVKPIAAGQTEPLGDDEKRTFVRWIDMGAMWDGTAGADDLPAGESTRVGATK